MYKGHFVFLKHQKGISKLKQLKKLQKWWVSSLFQTTTNFTNKHKYMSFIPRCSGNQKGHGGPVPQLLPWLDKVYARCLGLILHDHLNFFIEAPYSFPNAIIIGMLSNLKWLVQMRNCPIQWLIKILTLRLCSKLNFAPLMGIWIGSIIPWKFFPNKKPSSNPLCSNKIIIILYMEGIWGCGAKSSLVAFTSSAV